MSFFKTMSKTISDALQNAKNANNTTDEPRKFNLVQKLSFTTAISLVANTIKNVFDNITNKDEPSPTSPVKPLSPVNPIKPLDPIGPIKPTNSESTLTMDQRLKIARMCECAAGVQNDRIEMVTDIQSRLKNGKISVYDLVALSGFDSEACSRFPDMVLPLSKAKEGDLLAQTYDLSDPNLSAKIQMAVTEAFNDHTYTSVNTEASKLAKQAAEAVKEMTSESTRQKIISTFDKTIEHSQSEIQGYKELVKTLRDENATLSDEQAFEVMAVMWSADAHTNTALYARAHSKNQPVENKDHLLTVAAIGTNDGAKVTLDELRDKDISAALETPQAEYQPTVITKQSEQPEKETNTKISNRETVDVNNTSDDLSDELSL